MIRRIVRHPASLILAASTLALGLAVSVTMFTVIDSILLRPFPFQEQDRLVTIWSSDPRRDVLKLEVNWDELERFRKESQSFESIAAYASANSGVVINRKGDPVQLQSNIVSEPFFPILGVKPARGRLFSPADHKPGAPGVAVLSHNAWTGLFGSDEAIVGEAMTADGQPVEIIGVLPRHFDFPDDAQIMFPLESAIPVEEDRNGRFLTGLARLKPGASVERAGAELKTIAASIEKERPETHAGVTVNVYPLVEEVLGATRPALKLLFAMAIALFLIALSNVANVFLTRGVRRRREMSVRMALGATRWRLLRELSAESLMTTLLGATAGFALSWLALWMLPRIAPENLPRLSEVRINPATYGFLIVIALISGLVLAWFSIWRPGRGDLSRSLGEGGRFSLGRDTRSLLDGVAVIQVALTLLLLISAAVFLRAFLDMTRIDVGFRKENVITAHVPRGYIFGDGPERRQFLDRFLERVRALPRVEGAGSVLMRPLEIEQGWDFVHTIEGQGPAEQELNPMANLLSATPGYLEAMGIALRRGRTFDQTDTADSVKVAVISESFARRLGGIDQALGRRIKNGRPDSQRPWLQVVGVVSDVRYRALTTEKMDIYVPHTQTNWSPNYLAVRTTGDPQVAISSIRAILRDLDPATPLSSIKTTAEMVESKLAQPRLNMMILILFAATAVFLAGIGLYSLLTYVISARIAEMGVRVVLGATARDLRRLVLRESLRVAFTGVLLGTAAALLTTRLMSSTIFGIGTIEPLVLTICAASLVALCAFAALRPAARATRVDPIVVMRTE